MADGIFPAIIGAAATLGAATLGFVATIRKAQAIASLATVDDKRMLAAAEVNAIKVQASVAEQLGVVGTNLDTSGKVQLKIDAPDKSRR